MHSCTVFIPFCLDGRKDERRFSEDTYEGLPFAAALSMAMMERLGIRKMIDAESGKIDGGIYNLSTGMAVTSRPPE